MKKMSTQCKTIGTAVLENVDNFEKQMFMTMKKYSRVLKNCMQKFLKNMYAMTRKMFLATKRMYVNFDGNIPVFQQNIHNVMKNVTPSVS